MGGILAAAEEPTLASALTDIGTLVTKSVSVITGNSILFTIFCGGLMGIGFRVISQAKHASRA